MGKSTETRRFTNTPMNRCFKLVAGVGFVGPVKNIVVSGTRQGSYPILLVFSLVALASPSTGRACAPSPLPPPSVVEGTNPSRRETKKDTRPGVFSLLVAGVGFEPHDLRVMSPTSYQAALPRDIYEREVVPETGLEPVRDFHRTGF